MTVYEDVSRLIVQAHFEKPCVTMSTEKNYEGPCVLSIGITSKLRGAILINATNPIVSWRERHSSSLPLGLPRLSFRDGEGNVAFSFALDLFYAEDIGLRMRNADDDSLWLRFKFLHPHQHFKFRYDLNGVDDYISALALSTIWPSRAYQLEVAEPCEPENRQQQWQPGERVSVERVPIQLNTPGSLARIEFRFPSMREGPSFSP